MCSGEANRLAVGFNSTIAPRCITAMRSQIWAAVWCVALLLLGKRLLSLLARERVRRSVLEYRAITFHGIQHRLDMLRVAASSGLNVQTIVSGNGMGLAKLEKPQGRLLKVFLGTAVAELLSRLFEEMGHVVGLF